MRVQKTTIAQIDVSNAENTSSSLVVHIQNDTVYFILDDVFMFSMTPVEFKELCELLGVDNELLPGGAK